MRRSPLRSPPRVRGKVHVEAGAVPDTGITPACAGKRDATASSRSVMRDHPRVCGEKVPMPAVAVMPVGSPPRMRGKGTPVLRGFGRTGITPAYAGKSLGCFCGLCCGRDHPRVCGEKTLCRSTVVPVWGSPPRVRGKAVPLRSAAASGCRGPSVPEYDAPP